MSRLTKKGTRMVNDFKESDWYNKLANLEDLKDELGVPLEFYFKLTSGTKILDKSNNLWFLENITNHKVLNCYRQDEIYDYMGIGKLDFIYKKFKLKDYGKTWWLVSEREELIEE